MSASLKKQLAELESLIDRIGLVEPVSVLIEGTAPYEAYLRDPSQFGNEEPIIVRVIDARKREPVPA
ncbi:hypothetical protein [Kordiimonas sp.]|uniref:hypothetical protein n=1 Tax=Kordiimonas sp. TaxID=1970157 RepID=UPI003A8DE4D2